MISDENKGVIIILLAVVAIGFFILSIGLTLQCAKHEGVIAAYEQNICKSGSKCKVRVID